MPKRILKKIHHYTFPHQGNGYKPHSLRHGALFFYSVLLVGIKLAVLWLAFSLYPSQAEFSTITINRVVELTNQVRVKQGLPELQMSEILNQAATLKAQDMIKYHYFAHTSPAGVKPWRWFKEVGYNYTYAGENLAMNFIEAEDALRAWMDSPTHRDNILSKNYNEIGVAVAIGEIDGQETTVVVQLFGKRFVQVGKTFRPAARQVKTPVVSGVETTQVETTPQAQQQQVSLKEPESDWLAKLVKYSSKFFLIFLIFIIINLLLTIFIRLEIQHKPIIFHALLVILLAGIMILWKVHFMEGLGSVAVM